MSEQEYEFSPVLGELASALAKAQGEMQDAKKDGLNPHFKNKFATLSSVRAAITPALSKNNLAVVQLNEPHGLEGVCVVTLLIHSSGQWIRSRLMVPVKSKDAQGFGSAISYARRYALAAIVNVASDDDDDGEAAVQPGKPAPVAKVPTETVDVEALIKALNEAPTAEAFARAEMAIVKSKGSLSAAELERCRAAREARVREMAKAS